MQEKILDIIEKELGKRPASAETPFAAMDLDSLDFLSIITEVERQCDVTIPERVLVAFNNAKDVADWIEARPR